MEFIKSMYRAYKTARLFVREERLQKQRYALKAKRLRVQDKARKVAAKHDAVLAEIAALADPGQVVKVGTAPAAPAPGTPQ